jgi:hypothetical protein
MWFKSLFEGVSTKNVVKRLKEEGSLVGERLRNGRKIYIYLLKGMFVQVMFKKDDPIEEVEHLLTFDDINQLNAHLEREFKTAF